MSEADPACFTGCLPCQSMETMNRLAIRRALSEFIEIERNIPTINHILLLGTEFSGKSAVMQLIQNYCDVNWPRDDLLKRYVTIIRRHVFRLIG